jgi:hypothetical protein
VTALARAIEIASPADGGTEVRLTFAVPRAAGTATVGMPFKSSRDGSGASDGEPASRNR